MSSLTLPAGPPTIAPPAMKVSAAAALAGNRAWRRDLFLVILLALVQVVFFMGILGSDDLGYLHYARFGPFVPGRGAYSYALRFMHWGPLALAIRLLPGKSAAMAVVSMLAMAATLLVIGHLARRPLGIKRAWIPMALFGLMPPNILLATAAMPDLPGTAWAWLGLALCVPALLETEPRRVGLRCLAGGLLIAAGYNAKESVAILVPSLILFVLLYRTRAAWAWRRAALIAAGAALWVSSETVVLWCLTGDPLYHAHAVAQAEGAYRPAEVAPTLLGVFTYATEYMRLLLNPRSECGPIGLLMLGGLVLALLRGREAQWGLLACLAIPGFVYLSLGSTSIRNYQPVGHHPRYLMPILPAMALAAGLGIDRLWTAWPRWRIPFRLASGGAIAASLLLASRSAGNWYFTGVFQTARGLISEQADRYRTAGLYTSDLSAGRFEMPAEWLGGLRPASIDTPPATTAEWTARYGGAYVLTTRLDRRPPRKAAHDARTLFGPSAEALRQFPRVAYREPPSDRLSYLAGWLLGRPYSTIHSDAVEIYYIPPGDSAAGGRASHPPSATPATALPQACLDP